MKTTIDSVVLDFCTCEAYVDRWMDVQISIAKDCNTWYSHVSKLNEGKYPELYKSFIDFIATHERNERFELTFDEFRFMMQKIFIAYSLTK